MNSHRSSSTALIPAPVKPMDVSWRDAQRYIERGGNALWYKDSGHRAVVQVEVPSGKKIPVTLHPSSTPNSLIARFMTSEGYCNMLLVGALSGDMGAIISNLDDILNYRPRLMEARRQLLLQAPQPGEIPLNRMRIVGPIGYSFIDDQASVPAGVHATSATLKYHFLLGDSYLMPTETTEDRSSDSSSATLDTGTSSDSQNTDRGVVDTFFIQIPNDQSLRSQLRRKVGLYKNINQKSGSQITGPASTSASAAMQSDLAVQSELRYTGYGDTAWTRADTTQGIVGLPIYLYRPDMEAAFGSSTKTHMIPGVRENFLLVSQMLFALNQLMLQLDTNITSITRPLIDTKLKELATKLGINSDTLRSQTGFQFPANKVHTPEGQAFLFLLTLNNPFQNALILIKNILDNGLLAQLALANNYHPSSYNAYVVCELLGSMMETRTELVGRLKQYLIDDVRNAYADYNQANFPGKLKTSEISPITTTSMQYVSTVNQLVEAFDIIVPFLHQTLGKYASKISRKEYPVSNTTVDQIEKVIGSLGDFFREYNLLRIAGLAAREKELAENFDFFHGADVAAYESAFQAELLAIEEEDVQEDAPKPAISNRQRKKQQKAEAERLALEASQQREAEEAQQQAKAEEAARSLREREIQAAQAVAAQVQAHREAADAQLAIRKAAIEERRIAIAEAKRRKYSEIVERARRTETANAGKHHEPNHFHIKALPSALSLCAFENLMQKMESNTLFGAIFQSRNLQLPFSNDEVDALFVQITHAVREFLLADATYKAHPEAINQFCDSLRDHSLATRHNVHGGKGVTAEIPREYLDRRLRIFVNSGIIPLDRLPNSYFTRGAHVEYLRYAAQQAIIDAMFLSKTNVN